MSGISKATLSFESRPQIKMGGVKQPFKMMDVGGKSMIGVDLGNGTVARLKSMPGGKYDIELISKSGKELSDVKIRVTGGTLSRMTTMSGTTIQGGKGRMGDLTLNRDFASGFIAGGEAVVKTGDRQARLAEKVEQRLSVVDEINQLLAAPGLSSSERRKLTMERDAIQHEINRALDKQEGSIPPKHRTPTTTPPTLPPEVSISLDDEPEPEPEPHRDPPRRDLPPLPTPRDLPPSLELPPSHDRPPPKSRAERAKDLTENIQRLELQEKQQSKEVTSEIEKLSGFSEARPHGTLGLHDVICRYAKVLERSLTSGRPDTELDTIRKNLESSYYGADFDRDFAKLSDAVKLKVDVQKAIAKDRMDLARIDLS